MADLLIKPLTGAGNTVTIQDQAGGAILTSGNSGATIANATLTTPIIDTVKLTAGSIPGTPVEGQIYYDTSGNYCRVYDGSKWQRLTQPVNTATATSSASQVTYNLQGISYRVHRCTSTITDFVVTGTMYADILLVSGGGGGGTNNSGGGHAGGVLYISNYEIPAGTYTATVGAGAGYGAIGGTSSFNNLTATGGKEGSTTVDDATGVITITADPSTYDFCESYGGFGCAPKGGNAYHGGTGASGIIDGDVYSLFQNSEAANRGANGGAGVYIADYAGSKIYDGVRHYAWGGGGGGNGYQPYGGHGGNGGGGGGGEYPGNYANAHGQGGQNGLNDGDPGGHGNDQANGGDGGANTGSGGGAGSHTGGGNTSTRGGPGGSGIILIRYRGS